MKPPSTPLSSVRSSQPITKLHLPTAHTADHRCPCPRSIRVPNRPLASTTTRFVLASRFNNQPKPSYGARLKSTKPSIPILSSTDNVIEGKRKDKVHRSEQHIKARNQFIALHSHPAGTVVAYIPSQSAPLAIGVVLDTVIEDSSIKLRVFTLTGTIVYVSNRNVLSPSDDHPPSIPLHLVEACGVQDGIPVGQGNGVNDLASNPTAFKESQARSKVLQHLRLISVKVTAMEKTLSTVMDQAWDELRVGVPEEDHTFLTTDRIMDWAKAQLLRQDDKATLPSDTITNESKELDLIETPEQHAVGYFALVNYLSSRPDRFILQRGLDPRSPGTVRLKSCKEVKTFDIVQSWIRQDHPNVLSFLDKAQTLIGHSRSLLHATPSFPPPSPTLLPTTSTLPAFSPSDLDIIAYITYSLYPVPLQLSPYAATVPTLLKKVRRLGDRLDAVATTQFLVEIGVRTPWDDWASLTSPLGLEKEEASAASGKKAAVPTVPAEGGTKDASDISTSSTLPPALSTEASPSPSQPSSTQSTLSHPRAPSASLPGLDEFYPSDPCSSIRHDFGDLPVYVIDDPSASELDDGISIEPTSDPNQTWIHTHIADPTTLLHPNHRLCHLARDRGTTCYLPQGNYPLFPNELTVGRFSLGRAGSLGKEEGQECLTFSALVNASSGEVEEYRIRAGWVRNIVITTYSAVNRTLSRHRKGTSSPTSTQPQYPLGISSFAREKILAESNDRLTDPIHIAELTALDTLTSAVRRKRIRAGALNFSMPSYSIAVHPRPLPTLPHLPSSSSSLISSSDPNSPRPVFTKGQPTIDYAVSSSSTLQPAQTLVASCMTIAGSVAGRFFQERSLPAPYRTFTAPLTANLEAVEALRAARDPTTGEVSYEHVLKSGAVFSKGQLSCTPGDHYAMGIKEKDGGYVRVTSPLRRFTDVIAHWQIKHALLAEHDAKSDSTNTSPYSSLSVRSSYTPLFDMASLKNLATASETGSELVKTVQKSSLAYWAVTALFNHARALAASFPSPNDSYPPHLPPFIPLGRYEALSQTHSTPSPTKPGCSVIRVFVPDLALPVWIEHDSSVYTGASKTGGGPLYEPGDRLEVMLDRFVVGPQSEIWGSVVRV